MIILKTWAEIKSLTDNFGQNILYFETPGYYRLFVNCNNALFTHDIVKDSGTDHLDFENNYKIDGNLPLPTFQFKNGNLNVIATSNAIPNLTNKYDIDFNDDDISIISSYSQIYSYNGSGAIYGFVLDFNSNNVHVKLKIDSEVIFDLKLSDISRIQSTGKNFDSLICKQMRVHSGNKFEFCPPYPISYSSNILIEAKKSSGSNKTLNKKIVFINKDT